MTPNQIVDISLFYISTEQFTYILADLTTMIANIHFDTNYSPEEIYNYIIFKDNNNKNLDVNNMVLID